VQLEPADVIRRGGPGRALQKSSKTLAAVDVASPRALPKLARIHVFEGELGSPPSSSNLGGGDAFTGQFLKSPGWIAPEILGPKEAPISHAATRAFRPALAERYQRAASANIQYASPPAASATNGASKATASTATAPTNVPTVTGMSAIPSARCSLTSRTTVPRVPSPHHEH
jgi:hypothetical protein